MKRLMRTAQNLGGLTVILSADMLRSKCRVVVGVENSHTHCGRRSMATPPQLRRENTVTQSLQTVTTYENGSVDYVCKLLLSIALYCVTARC